MRSEIRATVHNLRLRLNLLLQSTARCVPFAVGTIAVRCAAFALVCGMTAAAGGQSLRMVPTITTVAGTGTAGYSGDGGLATSAELTKPLSTVHDADGNLYIADYDNSRVRKVAYGTGIITTIAGTGVAGYSGDLGQATSAELNQPGGLALDSTSTKLYIGDIANNRVRMVNLSTGVITTIAGTGTAGFSGDNGLAVLAQFSYPDGLALDNSGNLYICDKQNFRVRKLVISTGIVTTVVGTGTAGFSGDGGAASSAKINEVYALGLDAAGNLYLPDSINERVRFVNVSTGIITTLAGNGTMGFSGDGGLATAAVLNIQHGTLAVDSAGNILINDQNNQRVRMINAATGIIDTIAGTGGAGYTGDGGPATSATFMFPERIESNLGNIYISDISNNVVRSLTMTPNLFAATQVGSTVTQNVLFEVTGAATTINSFTFNQSQGGSTEFTEGTVTGCTIGASNPVGTICTVPITFKPAYPGVRQVPFVVSTNGGTQQFGMTGTGLGSEVALTAGTISTVAGTGTAGATGNGGTATAATLNHPGQSAVDYQGNMFIADATSNEVRKVVASTGKIVLIAGNGTACATTTAACGDAGAATSANLNGPTSVALDAAGNLYIADTGDNRVRRVDGVTGVITTYAGTGTASYTGDAGPATLATMNGPKGVILDTAGNLYVADTGSNAVRKVGPTSGIITSVAGNGTACATTTAACGDSGAATAANLKAPAGVAVSTTGLVIADTGDNRVRAVNTSTGIITTIAGTGTAGYTGDGGAATSATLSAPGGVTTDSAGDIYIAGTTNSVIRFVSAGTGKIGTIVGTGTACATSTASCGDGGASTAAMLASPGGIALDGPGNLYVSDTGDNRVREVNVSSLTLNFATTAVGATSSDSPQSATVENIGNQTLTVSVPGSGSNPAVSTGFNLGGASTCPQLTSTSSAGTLASGYSCAYSVNFAPSTAGTFAGTLAVTDNGLNAAFAVQTVNLNGLATKGTPTTTLVSAMNPSTYGQSVTFTATVGGLGVAPTGTVSFYNGATLLGTGTVNGSGVATFATGALPVGSDSITAVYGGDANYNSATSNAVTQTVNKANGADALTTSNATPTYGTSVTLTDTIPTVNGVAPTGTVTFYNGSTSIGTGTVNASGVATLATGALPVGSDSITAVYGGNANYASVTSNAVTETVAKANGTDALTTSNASPTYGTSITLTDTIPTVNGVAPTGTVTFKNGSTTLGTGTINASGVATLVTSALPVGTDTVTATYPGDTNYASGSATVTETVGPASSASDTLTTSNASPTAGSSVTLTFTVTPVNGVAPTGTVTFKNGATTLGTGTINASGVATLVTSALPVGTDTVTATYLGDANYASGSAMVTETVGPASSASDTLTTSNASPTAGSSVTLTFTVTPVNGVAPTGTITFKNGATTLGTGMINASGVATLVTSALPVGTDTVTATYPGDTNYASGSATVTETVGPASSASDTLTTSNASPTAGSSVTLTFTVTPVNGVAPTGTITFKNGATTLGTGTINASGVATLVTSALPVGTDTVTATYPGDANYASGSATVTETVGPASSASDTLTTSNASPTAGSSVTLTFTVTPVNGVAPTGTVTFKNGATTLGAGTINASGVATLVTSALPVGTDTVTATYTGDTNYASGSATVTETVGPASSASDTLTTSNASPTAGSSVTLTFTVTPVNGVAPTGTVTFKNGSTTLGTGTLNASGVATLVTSALPVGTDTVTATYPGDANYATGSSTVTETVGPASSASDTLATSNASPTAGTSITLTFTVTPVNGVAPTGTITFKNGSTTLGTGTLNASGVATLVTSALPAGADTVTATYPGDANYASGSATVTETVGPASSGGDTLTTSNASPTAGSSVTLTFTVTPVNGVTPTGTVTFKNGSITLGTGTLSASGVATLSTSALPVGTDTVTATYPGDANYASGSATVTETVGPASSASDTLTTNNASPTAGTSITLTFTVTPVNGVAPTGTVTFKNGATTLGTGMINASGVATLVTSSLPVGTDNITASYPGDTNYAAGSGSLTETVGPASSSGDTLTSDTTTPSAGTPVMLTFTVPLVNGVAPTGTITFKNGSTTLGTAVLTSSGTATLTTSALPTGTDTVTATYPGDANYASGSASIVETVGAASSSGDTLISSNVSPTAGTSVTLTFTIPVVNGVAPTGTVTFKNGATTLGTGTVNASGVATFTTSTLPVGTATITGNYPGDGNYSAGSANVTETVGPASSASDTLTTSNASPTAGTPITLTFTVTPVNGVAPTGTVTFKNGSTTLGTGTLSASGVATLSTGALPAGTDTVTATYPGDANYASGSANVTETVGPATSGGDTLTSSNTSPSAGAAITLTFTVPLVNGVAPTGTVTFKNGSTTLGTGTISASGVATFATGALPVGTDTITATYPGDTNYAAGSGSVTETVGPASSSGDTLTTSNASPSVGTSITLTFTVPPVNGVAPTGTVTFKNGSTAIGTGTLNASGVATLVTSALPVGTDTVTATYPGDTNYAAGSGTVTETVSAASSSGDTLTTSNASPTSGTSITLTFTVPLVNGIAPTGTVTFKNGSTTIGTGTLNASGVATLTTGSLPVGTDTITATYPGDTNYAAGSGSVTVTVAPASSSGDTLTTSNASPTSGTSITLTFTVPLVNAIAPTGTVTFKNGSTSLGTGTINASGIATLATSALPVGTDTVTATYPGDANYASGSASVTETVGPASSGGDTLTSSNTSPTAGTSITLTFTVPLVNGVAPTGTVTFKNGSTTLGTATINASGVATFTTSALPAGTDALTAAYTGDTNYAAGSASLSLTVAPASSSGDTLTSDTTTPSSGSPVMFTFTVPLVNGVAPTGTITFKNGATTLGTAALNASGVATLTTSALPLGTDTVTATYPGDANYAAGSGSLTEMVGPANSSGDTLTTSNASPTAGTAVTLTFTVPVVNGVAPTGTITFKNGSTTLGTAVLNSSGVAAFTTSALPVGSDTVTGTYPGDGNYTAGSASVGETVGPASASGDTFTTSNASPSAGTSVTLTFTVPPVNGVAPTGTVTFKNGGTTLGTATLNASGVASLAVASLPVGTDTVTAAYPGDANYAAGSGSLTETVGPASSGGDTLTSNNASPTAGSPLTLTFTVPLVNGVAPTGTITFKNGSTVLGTATINASGVATFTTSSLPAGSNTLTATYPGDANYAAGSASLTQTVGPASSSGDTLTADTTTPAAGTPVMFTFTVPLVNGVAPTGTVTFKNGATVLGSAAINSSGVASFTTSALTAGSDTVTATYPGDANYAAGSASVVESVGPANASGDTLVSSNTAPTAGTAITLTFSIPVMNGVAPTGTVTFKNGATVLGMGAVNASGIATLTVGTLPVGTDTVTGSYPGDTNYAAGTAAVTETVGPAASTGDTLTANPANPSAGMAVTLTFTVPLVNGVAPTGTVTVTSGGVTLGTATIGANGVATLTTSALPVGSDTVTAAYSGDANYAGGSGSVMVAVGPASSAGDTLTASSTSPTEGTPVTLTFAVPIVNGVAPTGTVTFKDGGTVIGTGSISASGVATLTTGSLPAGSNTITATYPGDANYAAGAGSVMVTVGPASSSGDTLTANPANPTEGAPVTLTFTVPLVNGIAPTGTVTFKDGSTVIGTGTISASGVATLVSGSLPAGSDTITATYPGDANYAAGAGSVTVTVGPASSNGDTLTANPANPTEGSPVTLTFTVPLVNGIAPTGTVTFKNGNTVIGTGTISASGVATLITGSLPAGSNTLNATYPGDANYAAGAGTVVVTVIQASSSGDTLTANPTNSSEGSAVTLTFTVPLVNGIAPTGTVAFKDGSTIIGTGTISASGVATLTTSSLPVGSDTVTATYPGDANYAAGSGSVVVTVGPASSSGDTLTASNSTPSPGSSVTFTFTVPLVNGIAPTGTVTFKNGTTVIGTGTISASGVATIMTSTLPSGADTITASYPGDTNYAVGTASVTVTVGPASSADDTLTASASTSTFGTPITFTFTIPATNGVAASGTVAFASGGTALGTAMVNANGVATFTTSALATGDDTITGMYSGSSSYAAATLSVNVTVNLASPPDTQSTSNPSAPAGQAVTLSFTIPTVNGVPPTGTVTFSIGGTVSGTTTTVIGTATVTNGVATITTSSLPPGSYNITANYSGDAHYAPATTSLPEAVIDFTITASPPVVEANTVNPGQTAAYIISLGGAASLSFGLPVTLSATGAPEGAVVTFEDGKLVPGTGPTSTVMSVATSPLHTSVEPLGGPRNLFYGLFLLPVFFSRKVRRRIRSLPRGILRCLLAVALLGGIGAATGCGGGYVGTRPNTYTITVTGTSGTLSHSTAVTLTIR